MSPHDTRGLGHRVLDAARRAGSASARVLPRRSPGAVDEPVDEGTTKVRVTGWTFDSRLPTRAVVITVNGTPVATTETGVARPDVLGPRRHSAAANSGFSVYVDLSPFVGEEITLGGWAVREHGITDVLREARFTVSPPTTGLGPALAGMPREEPVGAGGSFDVPEDGADVLGDVLYIRGGVLFPGSRTARVEIEVDGVSVGLARTFVEHVGATETTNHVDAPVASYEMHIVVEAYPRPGEIVLSATAESLDGRTWHSHPKRVLLPERPEPKEPERGQVLVERTRTLLKAEGRPRGDGVLVLTHDLSLGGGQLWLWDLVRQLHAQPDLRCRVVATGDGPLRRRLESVDIEVHVTAPLERLTTADAYEGRVRELALLAQSSGCRVALVNTVGLFAGADAAQRVGLPTVWAIHESYPPPVWLQFGHGENPDPHVRRRLEHALANTAALAFEARQTSELFANVCPERKRFVVPYGVDLAEIDAFRSTFDRDRARAELDIAATERVILVMGVFEARKAQGAVLAAFDELAAIHPDVTLALVGAHVTDYTSAIYTQAERSGLRLRVRLVGITPDIYRWYGLSDLFLCASDVESLPRSVLEAMAFELPVVATEVWGLIDLIRDGENGWVFAPRDLESLVGTLHRVLMQDAAAWSDAATAGRRDLEVEHDVTGYAEVFGRALRAIGEDPEADLAEAFGGSTVDEPAVLGQRS